MTKGVPCYKMGDQIYPFLVPGEDFCANIVFLARLYGLSKGAHNTAYGEVNRLAIPVRSSAPRIEEI